MSSDIKFKLPDIAGNLFKNTAEDWVRLRDFIIGWSEMNATEKYLDGTYLDGIDQNDTEKIRKLKENAGRVRGALRLLTAGTHAATIIEGKLNAHEAWTALKEFYDKPTAEARMAMGDEIKSSKFGAETIDNDCLRMNEKVKRYNEIAPNARYQLKNILDM